MPGSHRWPRLVLPSLFLLYGILTFERETGDNGASTKWSVLALCLYALPLLCQLSRRAVVRVYAVWLGVFLILQTLLSLAIGTPTYLTLQRNLRTRIQIQEGVPGVSGEKIITTDEMGFRVQPAVDYARKRGKRVFAIGASTTEEIFLDDSQTWTHLLQGRLTAALGQPVEVINTGVSGLRAVHHLATLKRVGRLQADAVIVLLGINDWNRQILEHVRPPPPSRFLVRETYRLQNTMLGKVVERLVFSPVRSVLRRDRRETINEPTAEDSLRTRRARHSYQPEAVSAAYAATLREIGATCRALGVPCLFLTQPTGYRMDAPVEVQRHFWMTPPYADFTVDLPSLVHISGLYNRHLLKFASEEGHPVLDLAGQLGGADGGYENFYDDCHFSERGAARVAELLTPKLAAILKGRGN